MFAARVKLWGACLGDILRLLFVREMDRNPSSKVAIHILCVLLLDPQSQQTQSAREELKMFRVLFFFSDLFRVFQTIFRIEFKVFSGAIRSADVPP